MTTYGTIPTASTGATNLEYLTRAKQAIKTGLGTRQPWKQMFNLASFNFPHTISEATPRFKTNINYFRMNYAIIMLIILFLSLLWHPISLIVLGVLMAAWLFFYFLRDEPLMVFNRVIDDGVVLTVLAVVTIVLLLFTDATQNILSSVVVGVAVVVVHAVLRRTDDLCDDDVEAGGYAVGSSS
ncbi:putative prenylated rab acceptor P [Helianthus annuus]|nr:putative prenylated rab acceptor P [Helianthus annuus]KAJ0865487.1 putative prenylated rab acceptor P [Helianthus annuus]